jgi:parallel beta-helix repeat protein
MRLHTSAHLCLVSCVLILLSAAAARTQTWRVPSECPTIHAGLDSALAGDTVLVAPGVYPETADSETWIIITAKVYLASESGPEATTIEVCDAGGGISLDRCGGTVISGFTIRYRSPACIPGMGWPFGIVVGNSVDVIIEDCIIDGTGAYGIWILGQAAVPNMPVIRNNKIRNCAYGISSSGQFAKITPLLEGNTITDCNFGIESYECSPTIDSNTVTHCRYWGITFYHSPGAVCTRNLIAHNGTIGVGDAGGVFASTLGNYEPRVHLSDCSDPTMANDIYDNVPLDACTPAAGSTLLYADCNYWGSRCPGFVTKMKGQISYGAWVDSTHTEVLTSKDCPGATEQTTWGAIKAIFK